MGNIELENAMIGTENSAVGSDCGFDGMVERHFVGRGPHKTSGQNHIAEKAYKQDHS